MATECEIDRLSALPDDILIHNILSLLSLRDVVSTSVLSTRWRFLWKQIPHLDFSEEFFESLKLPLGLGIRYINKFLKEIAKYINDIIDNILLLHSGHIERFSIHMTVNYSASILDVYSDSLWKGLLWKGLHVERWIRYAALQEVKNMSLKISSRLVSIPPSIFACRGLRNLELEGFRLEGIPTDFNGFRSLQSCSLSNIGYMYDDDLQRLIGSCPHLHKLVIAECFRLVNLKIQAPNLNSLNIVSCFGMESLTADCPQLVELEFENCKRLHEFRMNCCALFHDLHTSDVQIPKELPMLNSLRKLSVKACPRVSDLTLLTTLAFFRNLEEVHIQIYEDRVWQIYEDSEWLRKNSISQIFKDHYLELESAWMRLNNISQIFKDHYLEQESAKGNPVADSTFPSLKKVYVDISSAIEKEEAYMLEFLLNNAPSLNTITLTLPDCPTNIHDEEFINKVLDLEQIYEKVEIRMQLDEKRLDAACMKIFNYYGERSEY